MLDWTHQAKSHHLREGDRIEFDLKAGLTFMYDDDCYTLQDVIQRTYVYMALPTPPRGEIEPEHPEIPKSTYVPLATQLRAVPDRPLSPEVAAYIRAAQQPCACGHLMREHVLDKFKCTCSDCGCIHYETPGEVTA